MSQSVRFTGARVKQFACQQGKQQDFIWDSDTEGLGLRATDKGAKSYVFQGRVNRKSVRITIGSTDTWMLAEAQAEARKLKVLCDSGTDPRSVKAGAIEAAKAEETEKLKKTLTLADIWPEYIEANKDRWSPSHLEDHIKIVHRGGEKPKYNTGKLTIPAPLAALLDEPVAALTQNRLEEWVKIENKTRPTKTALAYRLLRACLNWAAEQDQYHQLINTTPIKSRKVRAVIRKTRAKKDSLQHEQIQAFFKAALGRDNKIAAAWVLCTLIWGARSGAAKSMEWQQIDFRWKTIRIWDKDDQDYRIIPLTPYVEGLLTLLPRRNAYVFSSMRSESGHIESTGKIVNDVIREAGLPHLTPHGLRRSLSSLAEWVKMPAGVVSQIQGHKPSGTKEKHYTQRPIDLLRLWHTRLEQWILVQAGILPAGEFESFDIRDIPE